MVAGQRFLFQLRVWICLPRFDRLRGQKLSNCSMSAAWQPESKEFRGEHAHMVKASSGMPGTSTGLPFFSLT